MLVRRGPARVRRGCVPAPAAVVAADSVERRAVIGRRLLLRLRDLASDALDALGAAEMGRG